MCDCWVYGIDHDCDSRSVLLVAKTGKLECKSTIQGSNVSLIMKSILSFLLMARVVYLLHVSDCTIIGALVQR